MKGEAVITLDHEALKGALQKYLDEDLMRAEVDIREVRVSPGGLDPQDVDKTRATSWGNTEGGTADIEKMKAHGYGILRVDVRVGPRPPGAAQTGRRKDRFEGKYGGDVRPNHKAVGTCCGCSEPINDEDAWGLDAMLFCDRCIDGAAIMRHVIKGEA